MVLQSKSLEEVRSMNEAQRTAYFNKYAAFFPSAPNLPYAIRVGSKTLHSADTMDLRIQFDKLLQTA